MENEKKFCLACLETVKENIIKGRKPIYNPICMLGLSEEKRYELICSVFDKEFKKLHTIKYISCEEIKIEEEFDCNKELIMIENIELSVGNSKLQEKIANIINDCLENNTQMILCSNENIEDLILEEHIKCRLKWGLSLYLK